MRIHYHTHVSLTGYARAGLDLCLALVGAGVDLTVFPVVDTTQEILPDGSYRARLPSEYLPLANMINGGDAMIDDPTPEVVVIHTLPFGLADAKAKLIAEGVRPARWIAYTTWEFLDVPDALWNILGQFDEVWTPSHGALTETASMLERPPRVIPHGFDAESLAKRRLVPEPADDRYRFYYTGAFTARKNPVGAIRAFAAAFGHEPVDTPTVALELHTPNAHKLQVLAACAATGMPQEWWAKRLALSIGFLSPDSLLALHRENHCLVTPSRGEAWNYGAFDAVLAGRHVITTDGLGSDAYLADTTAFRIPGDPAPAYVDVTVTEGSFALTGAQGVNSTLRWVEPQMDRLVYWMRESAYKRHINIMVGADAAIHRMGFHSVGRLAADAIDTLFQETSS